MGFSFKYGWHGKRKARNVKINNRNKTYYYSPSTMRKRRERKRKILRRKNKEMVFTVTYYCNIRGIYGWVYET